MKGPPTYSDQLQTPQEWCHRFFAMKCELPGGHDGPCGQEKSCLQYELLDLIKLMPDAQVDELLSFIATLREARALRSQDVPL